MTPRERVVRAVEMRGPDRIPIHRYVMPGAFHTHGLKLVDLLNALPVRIVAHRRQGQAVGARAAEVVLEIDAHATITQGGLKESHFMF